MYCPDLRSIIRPRGPRPVDRAPPPPVAASSPPSRLSVELPKDTAAFKVAENAAFYEWWSRLNGGDCPRRDLFDIVDHPVWAANIFLIRVEGRDPWVFRFRLIGDEAVALIGRNETGLTLTECGWDRFDGTASRAYADMIAQRRPLRFHGCLAVYNREYAEFESIDAPFVDAEGRVTAVIGLICRV